MRWEVEPGALSLQLTFYAKQKWCDLEQKWCDLERQLSSPICSKVTERAVFDQLHEHLQDNDLYPV